MNKQAGYYDAIYRTMLKDGGASLEWCDERIATVMPWVIGSVFDIGCGLGHIANLIKDRTYIGTDISQVAIEYAKSHCKNKNAMFFCLDYLAFVDTTLRCDTVLMLEVLEHVEDCLGVVQVAKTIATKRIVVTVPRDMPGRAHVHPKWNMADLSIVLGGVDYFKLFGGPDSNRWWLAVKEVGDENKRDDCCPCDYSCPAR